MTNVYLNGCDVTGTLNKVSFPLKQDVHKTPVFGKSAYPKILGLDDASPKFEGWLDNATKLPEVLDVALSAPSSVLVYLPDGDSFGSFGWGAEGQASDVESGSDDAPNKITGGFQSSKGGERICSIFPLSEITGATNGTSHDNGVSTSTKCVAYLQCTTLTGFSSLDVKIQHSSDGSSWSDLAMFTTLAASNAKERISIAAGTIVQKFTRAVLTPTGSGSATVFIGFGRYPN